MTAPEAKVMVAPAEIAPESPVVVPPSRNVPAVKVVQIEKYGQPPASAGIPVIVCVASVPPDAFEPALAATKVIG